MQATQRKKRTCSQGHIYYKSSDCPVCPKCWKIFYENKSESDLPKKLSAPALRALLNEKIYNLTLLSNYTEKEILSLHGMGKASIPLLKEALQKQNLTFKSK